MLFLWTINDLIDSGVEDWEGRKKFQRMERGSEAFADSLHGRWNYALSGGLKARDFHATNVVLHAAVSSLSVLVFARMVGEQRRHRLSFLSAVLYAVHPVKTEAVNTE